MEPAKDKYRLLIDHLPDAFASHQLITDDAGKPVDYIFLHVKTGYEVTAYSDTPGFLP